MAINDWPIWRMFCQQDPEWVINMMLPDEVILYKLHYHWCYWVPALIWPLIVLGGVIFNSLYFQDFIFISTIMLAFWVLRNTSTAFNKHKALKSELKKLKEAGQWDEIKAKLAKEHLVRGWSYILLIMLVSFIIFYNKVLPFSVINFTIICWVTFILTRFGWWCIDPAITYIYTTDHGHIYRSRIFFAREFSDIQADKSLEHGSEQGWLGRKLGFGSSSVTLGMLGKIALPRYASSPEDFTRSIKNPVGYMREKDISSHRVTIHQAMAEIDEEDLQTLEPSIEAAAFGSDIGDDGSDGSDGSE